MTSISKIERKVINCEESAGVVTKSANGASRKYSVTG